MAGVTVFVLAGYFGQAVWSLVLAGLLFRFWRTYRRRYLGWWAASWLALAVYQGIAGAALFASMERLGGPGLRLALSSVSLVAGYVQVGWLLFGTLELARGRGLGPLRERATTVALAAAGLAAAIAFSLPELTPQERVFGKVGLRALVAGVAFLAAAVGCWVSRAAHPGLGARLLAVALALYGLEQFPTLWYSWPFDARTVPDSVSVLGLIDLLLQGLIGLGMAVWLLEEEQTRVREASREIQRIAARDPVTGLANRSALLSFLDAALTGARRGEGDLCLAIFDILRFRTINDTFGPAGGDEVLRVVGRRARDMVRPHDLVARVAADEFAVVWTGDPPAESAIPMAERLRERVEAPVNVLGETLEPRIALGVARTVKGRGGAEELLRNASLAKDEARRKGERVGVFEGELAASALERRRLEVDLRRALDHGELVVHYQPIFDARSGTVDSLEALVRWPRDGSLWTPGKFLHVAEIAGIADRLDDWILREALRYLATLRDRGFSDLRIAVNVSARRFHDPELADRFEEELARVGLPAAALVVELTENVAMQEGSASLALLNRLKRIGAAISIDDFGTGYSSLSYLRLLPVDSLKIDRSFVRQLERDEATGAIIRSIVALAGSLGLTVVAEGVETERQRELVASYGCDLLQGFLLGRPVAPDALDGLLGTLSSPPTGVS